MTATWAQAAPAGPAPRTTGPAGPAPRTTGKTVVVGVDDSPSGLAALRWAMEFARARRARLVAVRTWALGLPRHGGRRRRGGRRGHVVLTYMGAEPRDAAEHVIKS